jgi:hypothetical protein
VSINVPGPEWKQAVSHSEANPNHVLIPYDDRGDGLTHVECLMCPFDTYTAG